MMHSNLTSLRRGASLAPPLLVLGLLIVLPRLLSHERGDDLARTGYVGNFAASFSAAPLYIGDWVGEDVPVPTAAVEMLRPTAVLSRRFRHTRTGQVVSLLIVHCGDARDMGGHYPPRCYPSQGWLPHRFDRSTRCDIDADSGTPIALSNYNFVRGGETERSRLRVLNCFVAADGTITPDRPRINYLLERNRLSARGVAQIQFVTSGRSSLEEALDGATEILRGHSDLLSMLLHRGVSS